GASTPAAAGSAGKPGRGARRRVAGHGGRQGCHSPCGPGSLRRRRRRPQHERRRGAAAGCRASTGPGGGRPGARPGGAPAMKDADVEPFFATLRAANPQPASELEYTSVFELLVAVLLSAQATDAGVNKATRRLFLVADTPQKMLALGDDLAEHIRTIGLYRTKAANLLRTCRMLVDEHGGQVPRTREALEALPGVGRKTANVVLNVAFGEPTLAVDTHVFRVANRTGLSTGTTPLEVELRLVAVIPHKYMVDAHHWLILLGRYVCVARKPQCWRCAVAPFCDYAPKTPAP